MAEINATTIYKTLERGFAHTTDGRLCGFARCEATEDARVAIEVSINPTETGKRQTTHGATFDPWFALSLAEALTSQAHAALRLRQSRAAEALVAAMPNTTGIQALIRQTDEWAVEAANRGDSLAATRLAKIANAIAASTGVESEG